LRKNKQKLELEPCYVKR